MDEKRKLEKAIDDEIQSYSKRVLEDDQGYKYYSKELEATQKRKENAMEFLEKTCNGKILSIEDKIKAKEAELEAFRVKIQSDIETIRRTVDIKEGTFEAKKQAIADKYNGIIEDYISKIKDISNNFQKPNSKIFREREQKVERLNKEIMDGENFLTQLKEGELKKKRQDARDQEDMRLKVLEMERLAALEKVLEQREREEEKRQTRERERLEKYNAEHPEEAELARKIRLSKN